MTRLPGRRAALLAAILLGAPALRAAGVKTARELLLKGDAAGAVVEYSRVRLTRHPEVAAEYAYALALAGYPDLALGHLDQAFALQSNDAEKSGAVNYFAARVHAAGGRPDAARELEAQSSGRPAWLPADHKPVFPTMRDEPLSAGAEAELAVADGLMAQRRFHTAAARFHRILAAHPKEAGAHAGYAIALEKIGAYGQAARAVGRSLELAGAGMPAEDRAAYEAHKAELESRILSPPGPAGPARKANLALKGRYLAFLGGNVNRTSQSTVSSLNGRVGKFFTDRVDASVTAGYTGGNLPKKYRGASFGLASRYHQPLPVPAPLNATFGARLEYQPRPSQKTSFVLSPGLSWVQETGSLDLYYEYGVSGRLKKSKTISLGYTVYFGGNR